MATTLSQRIKAARNYADLRQQDIADACAAAGIKVSRSAVAQWEYEDERRTQPSIEHIKVVAKRTGVPLDWLLNDNAALSDIWHFAKMHEAPKTPMPISSLVQSPVTDRFQDAYNKAIEFAVLSRKPEMASAFGRQLGQSGLSIQPDFVWGNIIAEFKTTEVDTDAIGSLLMAEQALARKFKKVVILLTPQPGSPSEVFGIDVYPVATPDQAAERLISLT